MNSSSQPHESFDIIIIGAGLSGINIAHYLHHRGPAGASYAILEARDVAGGTWSLCTYPGIRSDSDMYTFGFSWNPWKGEGPFASGSDILAYLNESAAMSGIDKNIKLNHQVVSAAWSSAQSMWNLETIVNDHQTKTFGARFLVLAAGFYDYEQRLTKEIPGLGNFKGPVVHPLSWPTNLDYTNKNVVVIGSGATAITVLPAMARDARHVTMLQRSPSYVVSLPPEASTLWKVIRFLFPAAIAGHILRTHSMLVAYTIYYYCMFFPRAARRWLLESAARQLPPSIPVEPHFSPRYNPWEQRLCVCPGGDFYAALRSGKANIVTDSIKYVKTTEIHMASGRVLTPDIIVTATGLKLRFGGGIKLSLDGTPIDPSEKFTLKNCMIQDVPNLAFVFGYVNASWTLGAEATSTYLFRLWNSMKVRGAEVAVPRVRGPMEPTPLFNNMKSTYLRDSSNGFPKSGRGNWEFRRNYLVDAWRANMGDITSDLDIS